MKIDELITELTAIREEYGNILVKISDILNEDEKNDKHIDDVIPVMASSNRYVLIRFD